MFDEIGTIAFNIKQLDDFDLAYHSDYMGTEGLWGFKNEKGKIIGEEKNWKQVCQTYRNKSKYKYEASTMDGKYYVFNIKDNNIVDMLEISHDDFLRKY